jgi:hypothetical protein
VRPSTPPNSTDGADTASDVATKLKNAASAKNEEAAIKKQQATEKRAAADQKQRDATAKRAAANSTKLDADAKKVQVQKTRNTLLRGITDVKIKKKVQLVVDAAIAGINVTIVKASFTAASKTAACNEAYLKMNLLSTLGACDVSSTVSDRRQRFANTVYLVEILLSSAEVTQLDIDNALTTLSAAGVIAETSNEDSLVLLPSIPGIDTGILKTFQNEVTAAVTATTIAEAAETVAVATESAAAILETDATAAEKVAAGVSPMDRERDGKQKLGTAHRDNGNPSQSQQGPEFSNLGSATTLVSQSSWHSVSSWSSPYGYRMLAFIACSTVTAGLIAAALHFRKRRREHMTADTMPLLQPHGLPAAGYGTI